MSIRLFIQNSVTLKIKHIIILGNSVTFKNSSRACFVSPSKSAHKKVLSHLGQLTIETINRINKQLQKKLQF